ncbi:M48 family metallopeptidase [Fusobacterium polymorphum]|uniref:Zinc protease n=2 Tax=Fusobacterium nucleatum subsp. polymorphum TaxID=76857 RepID=A0A2C6CA81_FUSNP|nr:zinc protease [Fusobacterium polymorphum]PHI15716.1 zinc protease [Fusobacterium polymorphum]
MFLKILEPRDFSRGRFSQSKKEWIETTLKKIKIIKENKSNLKENSIKILGKEIDKKIIESDLERIRLTDTSIYIYSKNIDNAKIEKKLLEWKLEKLKVILDEYLIKYTKLLNRNINYYQIKKLSSAWGIYHKKENYISFNSDLIEKDIECIEYVVLHELCHIFYMNHQKDFWALVEKYMPDYKVRRKNLKTFI